MKTTKPALQNKAQEECGVWLDTVQLKGKTKQKRPTRPISKLLNQFAEGSGYNLAVALNFTQTKMEMPKTQQSSISAFFTRQPQVPNQRSSSEVPNMDPGHTTGSSPSHSSSSAPVVSGIKRRRGICPEKLDSQSGLDQEWKSKSLTESTVSHDPDEENITPSKHMFCHSEEDTALYPPQTKKRLVVISSLAGDSQPPQAWSQDPLLTYSQYCDSESYQTHQIFNESAFLNSLQSEESIEFQMDLKERTSTQKSSKRFPSSLEDEKENDGYLFSKSPRKLTSFSTNESLPHHEWTKPKTPSPRKLFKHHLWSTADKEETDMSHFKKTKPSNSPLKKHAQKQQSKDTDEDSLTTLFTQDSEGFRVIAHRGLQDRSPLKESNFTTGLVRTSAYKSLVEEEDEMLFTQDSQGNMVIKH